MTAINSSHQQAWWQVWQR